MKFYIYARKSTDDEERQMLSIEAQLAELREYASNEGVNVTREFVESRTAKTSGRPIFNDMLSRMENGEASGLLAWHPEPPSPLSPKATAGQAGWPGTGRTVATSSTC